MASTLKAIRAGIAANLKAAFPDVNISAYMFPAPQPPCMDILPGPTEYDKAMKRGSDTVEITVRVMVAWNDVEAAQELLDSYCDPTGSSSVKTAIEADATLGGAVAWCRVTGHSGYQQYPHRASAAADIQTRVGVEFNLEMMT